MKLIDKLYLLILLLFINIPLVYGNTDKNLVNIYFFHSENCQHCIAEGKLLDKLANNYNNIRIYKYEINTDNNYQLLEDVASLFNMKVKGVPFTVIGSKVYKGYSEEYSRGKFIRTIEYYSVNGYEDIVGEYLGILDLPQYDINSEDESIDEYIEEKESYQLNIPLYKKIELTNKPLSLVTTLVALVDTINLGEILTILFLIFMTLTIKNKKESILFSITFILMNMLMQLLLILKLIEIHNLYSIKIFLIILILLIFTILINIKVLKKEKYKILIITFDGILFGELISIINFNYLSGNGIILKDIFLTHNLNLLQTILYIGLYLLLFSIIKILSLFITIIKSSKLNNNNNL